MILARDVKTARRAGTEAASAVGSIVGPVTGSCSGPGLEVGPVLKAERGVGVARIEITGSPASTSEAQADTIKTDIKNRVRLRGSRKWSFIFYLLSCMLYK
jgi:hypothetical protein